MSIRQATTLNAIQRSRIQFTTSLPKRINVLLRNRTYFSTESFESPQFSLRSKGQNYLYGTVHKSYELPTKRVIVNNRT
jgi:hypothetical protein